MGIASFLFVLFAMPSFSAGSQEPHLLTGTVTDEMGRGIPGVEVLVFEAGRDSQRHFLKNSITNSAGGFRIQEVNPGSYLLALNKPGYQILMKQVNTHIRNWLRLILLPGTTGNEPLPSQATTGMDWILRAPRRDLLKAWRAKGPPATDWVPEPVSRPLAGELGSALAEARIPSSGLPLNTEVEQWFTSGFPFQDGSGESTGSKGRTTSLDLTGDLGTRGEWELEGATETMVTEPTRMNSTETGQEANAVQLAMRYEMNDQDAIRFRAGYDDQSFRDAMPQLEAARTDQEIRVWGYRADWNRKAESGTDLEMDFGYLESSGRTLQETTVAGVPTVESRATALQDRQWSLGAAYAFHATSQHRVSVRARTRAYDSDPRQEEWIPAAAWPAFGLARPGDRGWAVSISGEDSWQLSSPTRLILGVDYHRVDRTEPLSVLVPRVGARREGERSVWQGHLLVRMDDDAGSDPGSLETTAETWGGDRPLGFRGEYQYRLGQTWTLGGHLEKNPFDLEAGHPQWSPEVDPAQAPSLFLVDPTATRRELGILVQKQFQGIKGSLESEGGRVSGRVSSRYEDSPALMLNEGEIRYVALRAVASVEKTETEVRLDYRRMAETLTTELREDPMRLSLIDLKVFQPLPFLERWGQAEWRILFACRSLERDLFSSTAGTPQSQRVHRISGGLGVSF